MRGFFGGIAQRGGNIMFTAPTVPDTTFDVAGGSYPSTEFPKPIVASCSMDGSVIYVTVDGVQPSYSYYHFTGTNSVSFSVNGNTAVKALATKPGFNESDVVSIFYGSYVAPTAGAPGFSGPGSYNNDEFPKSVQLFAGTGGTTVYYTTNGTTPTHGSPSVPSGGVASVPANATLMAISAGAGYNDSNVSAGAYGAVVYTCEAPVFSPAPGSYNNDQFPKLITLTSNTPGCLIQYNINGAGTTNISNGGTASVPANGVLNAVAFKTAWNNSTGVSGQYVAVIYTCQPPVFTPGAGSYGDATFPKSVNIASPTTGCTISYTAGGAAWSTGNPNGVNVTVSRDWELRALAKKPGWYDSAATIGTFTALYLLPIDFSPGFGTFPTPKVVRISTDTQGCQIRWTSGPNPGDPTESWGTLIAASVGNASVDLSIAGVKVKAIAFKPNFSNTNVRTSGIFYKS